MTTRFFNHLDLYRLPWNLADNGISWLEPTAQCDLACQGCYRTNRDQHKSFDEVLADLDVFARYRKSDALSIAGGEPLLYPDLVRLVGEARRRGYKPIVNTNAKSLTGERVRELAEAGLVGFTFHVDSKQDRPGKWRGKDEIELCELRDELAEMAASANVGCSFNATVYPDTLQYVGPLAEWGERRMDKVQVMVFILYRDMPISRFRFYSGDRELEEAEAFREWDEGDAPGPRPRKDRPVAVYDLDVESPYEDYLSTDDVAAELQKTWPDYHPAAYLNGTEDPASCKWLLAGRMGRPGLTYGWVGPKFMEIMQTAKHLWTGRYLAYASRRDARRGKPALLLAAFDRGLRRTAGRFLAHAIRSPFSAVFRPVYYQTVLAIQGVDFLPDGRASMCDGCPDITVWDGRLVWSCRMEEQERYGDNVRAVPRHPSP